MFEGLQPEQLPSAIEALLFVTDEPVSAIALAQMLEIETHEAQEALLALQKQLEEEERARKRCEDLRDSLYQSYVEKLITEQEYITR